MAKTKTYELRQGNIEIINPHTGERDYHKVEKDSDGFNGDPIRFEVAADNKDVIAALKTRKGVYAVKTAEPKAKE